MHQNSIRGVAIFDKLTTVFNYDKQGKISNIYKWYYNKRSTLSTTGTPTRTSTTPTST